MVTHFPRHYKCNKNTITWLSDKDVFKEKHSIQSEFKANEIYDVLYEKVYFLNWTA